MIERSSYIGQVNPSAPLGQGEEQPRAKSTERKGHPDRLVEWFTNWRAPIRNFLRDRALVSRTDADDLAQEVFVRLLRYSNGVSVTNPQGYIFRIALNVAYEWRSHSWIRPHHNDACLDDLSIDSSHEPENALQRVRANQVIRATINELAPRQREVLLLHINDGLTSKEIARLQGLTHRIVLRDISRAYGKLRAALKLEEL